MNETLAKLLRKLYGIAETGASAYAGTQQPYTAEQAKGMLSTMADFTPVVGDVKSAYEGIQAAREGDYVGAGLGALGALPMIPAMTAWHGSPHKFDKFSLDKIGTGEGAQAYGHGLYLAESPEVANQYLRAGKDVGFANFDNPQTLAGKALAQAAGDQKKAIEILNTLEQNTTGKSMKNNAYFAREVLNEGRAAANLYKTDIPDEAVARFLDWDKPLSQQAPEVVAALERSKNKHLRSMIDYAKTPYSEAIGGEEKTMGEAFRLLNLNLQGKSSADSVKASALLAKQGIPGIRYLDGGSRSAGKGSSNFVVFDPEMIRVLERNGQATGNNPWGKGEWKK